jgi:hypothetical protein
MQKNIFLTNKLVENEYMTYGISNLQKLSHRKSHTFHHTRLIALLCAPLRLQPPNRQFVPLCLETQESRPEGRLSWRYLLKFRAFFLMV